MNEISLAFPVTYASANKYLPLINYLGDKISKCYGLGFPRGFVFTKEYPQEKLSCTKIPLRTSFIVGKLSAIFKFPSYYSYWAKVTLCDYIFSYQIKKDPAKILYVSPLFKRTIAEAKKKGMIVVVEAGNSEPKREYERIMHDYALYNIKHKYVYGDTRFRDTCLYSLKTADKVITISKVSAKTYEDAGYDMSKFKLIPLTGTDMPLQKLDQSENKEKAFISVGFHNFIKGTQELLLAWKDASIKDIPLLIVGRICEDLKDFIEQYGPFNNVKYIGHRSDLKDWFSTYDGVGVLLSLSEGAVRVTPEMMSFGFPMIVSNDATCDIVVDGINGYIIDTYDIDQVSKRLKWFAEDWTRVKDMRKAVLNSVAYRSVKDYSLECGYFLESLI